MRLIDHFGEHEVTLHVPSLRKLFHIPDVVVQVRLLFLLLLITIDHILSFRPTELVTADGAAAKNDIVILLIN